MIAGTVGNGGCVGGLVGSTTGGVGERYTVGRGCVGSTCVGKEDVGKADVGKIVTGKGVTLGKKSSGVAVGGISGVTLAMGGRTAGVAVGVTLGAAVPHSTNPTQ